MLLNKNVGPQQLETVFIGLTFGPLIGATFSPLIGATFSSSIGAAASPNMEPVGVGANYGHTYKSGFCKVLEVPSFIFRPTSEVDSFVVSTQNLEILLALLFDLQVQAPKLLKGPVL